jgi:tartrate-resistant acid phosphatase type 5
MFTAPAVSFLVLALYALPGACSPPQDVPSKKLLQRLPLDWRSVAGRYVQITKGWEDQLLAKSDEDLQATVLQFLVSAPGADDFVLDHFSAIRSNKSLISLLDSIRYYPHWAGNARVGPVLDHLALSESDSDVRLASLETVRILEIERARRIVEDRLTTVGDVEAADKLRREDERLMDLEKGTTLPSYLRFAPPVFAVKTAGPSIRVLAIGDFGNGSEAQKKTAAAMVQYNRAKPSDFGITVGDNFTPSGMTSPSDPRWKTQWEDLYSPMKITFYPTFGNHDWVDPASPAAEISYSSQAADWKMPAPYYTYVAGPVQFFAIDTGPAGDMSAAQIRWLQTELEKSQARWKVVYGHHPPYAAAPGTGENATVIRELMPVLAGRADVYIAGHYHSLEHLKPVDGVNLYISGGGGRPLYPIDPASPRALFAKSVYGFTVLEANDRSFTVRFIGEDDTVLDESAIHK